VRRPVRDRAAAATHRAQGHGRHGRGCGPPPGSGGRCVAELELSRTDTWLPAAVPGSAHAVESVRTVQLGVDIALGSCSGATSAPTICSTGRTHHARRRRCRQPRRWYRSVDGRVDGLRIALVGVGTGGLRVEQRPPRRRRSSPAWAARASGPSAGPIRVGRGDRARRVQAGQSSPRRSFARTESASSSDTRTFRPSRRSGHRPATPGPPRQRRGHQAASRRPRPEWQGGRAVHVDSANTFIEDRIGSFPHRRAAGLEASFSARAERPRTRLACVPLAGNSPSPAAGRPRCGTDKADTPFHLIATAGGQLSDQRGLHTSRGAPASGASSWLVGWSCASVRPCAACAATRRSRRRRTGAGPHQSEPRVQQCAPDVRGARPTRRGAQRARRLTRTRRASRPAGGGDGVFTGCCASLSTRRSPAHAGQAGVAGNRAGHPETRRRSLGDAP
jgi:hypothetical protein